MTFNAPLEGVVNWLYCDRRGWVSTGIGNKMDETAQEMSAPSEQERAASLRLANEVVWTHGDGGPTATEDDVALGWDAVKSRLDLAAHGHLAYEDLSDLRLSRDEIDSLVLRKLDAMESVLVGRSEFAAFADWPANAQLATLSTCWALGPMFRFPKFQTHAAAADWSGCAEECAFGPHEGTIVIRNALDREHFLLAERVTAEGLPFESIAMDLTTVFGVQGALIALGYQPGSQDGADGQRTQAATSKFEADQGLQPTGSTTDRAFLDALVSRLAESGFNPLTT
ncbi:hypothetical protein G5C66_22955 [Nocardioides sp. KC13]|uniref:Peptidoglycan binding-like domain-containing protein n=1 Tax=Nocardioides turkmenicus TaxID=2711220 RepID=A0A6M1R7G6_9ACTN|nr:peptidoglycan-binding protein [Nocardioides sp. KC13]NGN95582.1 hypothetical protein [Nocardioides sp. KC13]